MRVITAEMGALGATALSGKDLVHFQDWEEASAAQHVVWVKNGGEIKKLAGGYVIRRGFKF